MNQRASRIAMACVLALAASSKAGAQVASPTDETATAGSEQEIVVTASKRMERLVDVPAAITAVPTADLSARGQVKIEDYAARVPGLVVQNNSYGGGTSSVTLRGIGGSYGSGPTVAIYVNDIPFNNSTRATQGSLIPDLDPSEFEQIEVLRGPQGTLYGGGTIGGVIKYVAKSPSYDFVSGRAELGGTTVSSGGLGYSARGAVNLPVSDNAGIRVSGFYRKDAGFIDNVQTGEKDVNTAERYGGRAVLGFDVGETLKVRVEGWWQHANIDGNPLIDLIDAAPYAQVTAGRYSVGRAPGTDFTQSDNKIVALHLDLDLDFATLTSISSYGRSKRTTAFDFTPSLLTASRPVFPNVPGPFNVAPLNRINGTKTAQEVRLTSSSSGQFTWQVAGFYTKEDFHYRQAVDAFDPTTGAVLASTPPTNLGSSISDQRYEEYAAFANATYKFSDAFDIGGGIRYSDIRQNGTNIATGRLLRNAVTTGNSAEHPITWMASSRVHFSRDAMAYFRVATGYRPGGINAPIPNAPNTYGADKAINYELGFKAEVLDRRLSLDMALFYIDWNDIQINAISSNQVYLFNGGTARSQGAEFTASFSPIRDLSLYTNFAFTDAKLTRDLPAPNVGLEGETLPGVARFSGLVGADYQWTLSDDLKASLGTSFRHVGKRRDALEANRYTLPEYDTLEIHAGLRKGPYSLNAFVSNLNNSRGQLSSFRVAGAGGVATQRRIIVTTPRTVGVTLAAGF